jgi:hypothetical protein
MMDKRSALLIALLCCFFLVKPSAARVSVNVPIGHWAYSAVDKLTGLGLIQINMGTTKPWTRMEGARLTLEAKHKLQDALSETDKNESTSKGRWDIIRAIVARLEHEFRAELDELTRDAETSTYIKPIEDVYVHYLYGENDVDIENDKGQELAKDSNVRAGFSTHGLVFSHFGYYLNPEYRYSEGQFGGDDDRIDLLEGYGKVEWFNMEVEAGRDSLWWGPGRHGSLILTDNAQPFDLVKFSNPRPVVLPWLFRYLGLFKVVAFWTELEKNRVIPEAELMGYRFHFKPFPLLDIGVSRTIMLGGEGGAKGAADLSLSDWAKVLSGKNISGDLNTNQIGGLDFEFLIPDVNRWVPVMQSISLWGEWYGEDEAGGLPSKEGYVAGLKFSDLLLTGRTDLILEYADNVISGRPGLWYSHGIYQTGYRYEGEIMGHNMGGDAREYYLRLEHCLSPDFSLGLDYNGQERGVEADTQEDRDRIDVDLTYQGLDGVLVRAGYRYEAIDNVGQIQGDDETNNILWLSLDYSF